MTSHLFDPLTLRGVTFRNRIGVSPMCQYSAVDGVAGEWHRIHLGSRAVGGAGLVFVEATAVEPYGRISPRDVGLWNDEQAEALSRVALAIKSNGAVPAIQLAHSGRKGSCALPWEGGHQLSLDAHGWRTVAPSAMAYRQEDRLPHPLDELEIEALVRAFVAAAHRAVRAGFEVVEVHAAHGYLLHEFLSPLSNHRNDDHGGVFDNRVRLVTRIVDEVRKAIGPNLVLSVRVSCTDWVGGGWALPDTVRLAGNLRDVGADLLDCSSGGNDPAATMPSDPGYNVPFAKAVRAQSQMRTAAVGLITTPAHAEAIVSQGEADMVLIGRESLRDPYFPLRAARALGQQARCPVPMAYARGWT